MNQVKEREITSKINVSDFEIESMLKKETSKAPAEFKISHILLKKENGYILGGEKLKKYSQSIKNRNILKYSY